MQLEFYGAAGHVTGSCHVLQVGGRTVLLDCGLIQGGRKDEARNADPFPFEASDVDAVVLSHAHIDHSGRLPLLCRRGFRGTIYAQTGTAALAEILLRDAAGLEASSTRRENRRRADRGEAEIAPLFDQDDVDSALDVVQTQRYARWFDVVPGARARFHDAGHILGSAVVELELTEGGERRTIVFSGDLGQYDSPILRDPVTPPQADLVLMESTYGDRRHRDRQGSLQELGEVLATASDQRGNILIPAFAVGRSQELLYQLSVHFDDWEVDRWHIFLDSPLAIEAGEIYWQFPQLHDEATVELLRGADDIAPHLPNLHYMRTADESRLIGRLKRGALIIAGSGMCNGGRILHHLKREAGKPNTHIVFTGFQPPGTLGRAIIDGASTIGIHGERYPLRAQVHTIGGFSAHGDRDDLMRWYGGFDDRPPVRLVHGEPEVAQALADTLESQGTRAEVARSGERLDLLTLAGSRSAPTSRIGDG